MSQAELARRCGVSSSYVRDVLAANAPVSAYMAVQLEREFGLDASIWLSIGTDFRLFNARKVEAEKLVSDA